MANARNHSADLALERNQYDDINDWSISKLINSLKLTFYANDYARVESVLLARELKNKREIEKLKKKNDEITDKFEEQKLEKMKYKKECEENEDTIAKLQKKSIKLREMEKYLEERYEKLMEELSRKGEIEKEKIDLKSENCKLENEIEILKKTEKGLREREEILEERCKILGDKLKERMKEMVDVKNRNLELEGEKEKAIHEKGILVKSLDEFHEKVVTLETIVYQWLEDQKGFIGGENMNSKDLGVKCNGVVKVENVLFGTGCDSHVKSNENPQNGGSRRHPSQNVIEIVDSDDDSLPVETMYEKGMTSLWSDQIGSENGGETLKRNYSSGINVDESGNGDVDDHLLSRPLKMKKREEPITKNKHPLNHCSTSTLYSGVVEVNEGLTTTVGVAVVSKDSEKIRDILLSLGEESCSTSDSD